MRKILILLICILALAVGATAQEDLNFAALPQVSIPTPMPNGYAQLSVQEQILVVSNLERGARGLNTFAGLSSTMDATAQGGANGSYDPVGPPGVAWGSNWAGDVTPLDADFNWVYNDGPGGFNIDCPYPGASGCWGHRNNLLGPYNGTMGVGVLRQQAVQVGHYRVGRRQLDQDIRPDPPKHQGQLADHGRNPYVVAPTALGDPRLLASIAEVWRKTASPYGPLFVSVSQGAAAVAGGSLVSAAVPSADIREI